MIRHAASAALLAVAVGTPMQLHAQSWKTVTSSRQVTDEDHLRVRVSYGAGVLRLRRAEAGSLYRTLFRFDEETAVPATEYHDGTLNIDLTRREHRGLNFGNRSSEASLDLELSAEVPLDIQLDFGAGRAELDLTGLPLRELEVNTGASESVLYIDEVNPEQMVSASISVGAADLKVRGLGNLNAEEVEVRAGLGSVVLELDGEWPRDGFLSVEMGLGALEIRVPESLGVRIRHRKSILSSIDAERMVKDGNVYRSINWDSAERHVEIDISTALGSIDLVWIN